MIPVPAATKILDAMGPTVQALTAEKIRQLRELVENPATTPEDFKDVLAPENMVAILIATGEKSVELPEVVQREVTPLEDLVKRELPGLTESDAFKIAAVSAHRSLSNRGDELEETNDASAQPTTIAAVLNIPFLVGTGDILNPVSRLLIRTNPPGNDFEFFANAEQLSAIASTFTMYLAQMLAQRASLANKGIAKISDPAHIAKAVGVLERALKTIRQHAHTFGIVLDVPASTDELPANETRPR